MSAAIVSTPAASEALLRYAAVLEDIEKPQVAVMNEEILPSAQQCEEWFSCSQFDHILLRAARLNINFDSFALLASSLLAKKGKLVMLCSPPQMGEKISRILRDECGAGSLAPELEKAEEIFFQNTDNLWDEKDLISSLEKQSLIVTTHTIDQKEERLITEKDICAWFNTEQSRWGSFMVKNLKKNDFSAMEEALRLRIGKGPLLWRWKSVCITGIN